MNNQYRVIRSRSDFYKNLVKYPKVIKPSGQQLNFYNQPISPPRIVERKQFVDFILKTDDLPPKTDENACIEVIAPILKKGKYKWKGIYEGETIDFYMKDREFKDSIFHQRIAFTNGVSLICILEISRKMNEIGVIYISNYSVLTVISYNSGENLIETKQGKQYFRTKENKSNQMNLFDKLEK